MFPTISYGVQNGFYGVNAPSGGTWWVLQNGSGTTNGSYAGGTQISGDTTNGRVFCCIKIA